MGSQDSVFAFSRMLKKVTDHTRPTPVRRDALFTRRRSRIVQTLNVPHGKRACLGRLRWAGENDGLFDHPAEVFFCRAIREDHRRLECQDRFYVVCEYPMTALPMCYSFQSAAVFLL
jgi:hypothetical protein